MQQAALTQDWPGGRLPEFVREMTTLAVAVISRDGILIDANLGFFNLLPHSMSALDILDVRELFLNPRFDQLATRRVRRTGEAVYRGILNLGRVRGQICSLQGTVYALDDAVLMAAEHEVAGLELLRTRVLQANEELVEEQRKLAAAVREIARQKQLLSRLCPESGN